MSRKVYALFTTFEPCIVQNVLAFLAYCMRFSRQCLANTEVRCEHPRVGIGVWVYRAPVAEWSMPPKHKPNAHPDFSSVGDQFSRNFSNATTSAVRTHVPQNMSANAQSVRHESGTFCFGYWSGNNGEFSSNRRKVWRTMNVTSRVILRIAALDLWMTTSSARSQAKAESSPEAISRMIRNALRRLVEAVASSLEAILKIRRGQPRQVEKADSKSAGTGDPSTVRWKP